MANPLGFAWEMGRYEAPDIVVPTVGTPAPRRIVDCPDRVIVYAAAASSVANCRGFAGLAINPWNNPVVVAAMVRASVHVQRLIACQDGCDKVARLIWIGWNCGNVPLVATGAVEIAVQCVLPDPSAVAAFSEACQGLDVLPAPVFLGNGWRPSKVPSGRRAVKQDRPAPQKREPRKRKGRTR